LPKAGERPERLDIKDQVAGRAVPTDHSFNLDARSIY
jgi:hypothetical protein